MIGIDNNLINFKDMLKKLVPRGKCPHLEITSSVITLIVIVLFF